MSLFFSSHSGHEDKLWLDQEGAQVDPYNRFKD